MLKIGSSFKFSLNYSKTNYALFTTRDNKSNRDFVINSSIKPVEVKNAVKYSGVIIDNTLTWEKHIQHVLQELSIFRGIVGKIRHFITILILKNEYFAIAYPSSNMELRPGEIALPN